MSVDFLSKNFPPFQVHHAKKPPRFYPDGFQRNVIDFYFIFSDCRLRKALYLQFSYFIWPLGKANGEKGLFQRLRQYMRYGFGGGNNHRGGRAIFQVEGYENLICRWCICEHCEDKEHLLLENFKRKYGTYPIANWRK